MRETGGLYEKLCAYGESEIYPMHMPGHKRNTRQNFMENPYGWDITEVEGFDDLHEPEGVLRDSMAAAAALYGADHSWFLINGSTAGILSGIAACTRFGDGILMARNCHKSVYHACVLNRLQPEYLYPAADPETGILMSIDPIDVDAALRRDREQERKIALVVITSPTYEGVLSDIQTIAGICHSYGVPLLVDEAHGAHLSSGKLYGSCFPEGAVSCGADLVVQSLHKTLPALTQTGLIHHCGTLVDSKRVKHCLDIYQTSSPSYILMASIDRCIRMLQEGSRQILGDWGNHLREFYRLGDELQCMKLFTMDSCERIFAWDPSKLVISVKGSGHTGPELMSILREEYHIELEMASVDYVIAMTGAGDTGEGIRRFADALRFIDERWGAQTQKTKRETASLNWQLFREVRHFTPCEADSMDGVNVDLGKAALGRTVLEFVFAYPPGIPILVPGEIVTETVLEVVNAYEQSGIPMRGYADTEGHKIRVAG